MGQGTGNLCLELGRDSLLGELRTRCSLPLFTVPTNPSPEVESCCDLGGGCLRQWGVYVLGLTPIGTSTWPRTHCLRPQSGPALAKLFGTGWLLSSSTWRSDRATVLQQQECPNMEGGQEMGSFRGVKHETGKRQASQGAPANGAL